MIEVLVVTGTSRGIGAATEQLSTTAGYTVCVAYNEGTKGTEDVIRAITTGGDEAIAVQGDMASADDIVRLFKEVEVVLGPVPALINNAAPPWRQTPCG